MSDLLRTVSPDELPDLSEIPEDLRAVVFSPTGPLQALPYEKLLTKLIATDLAKASKATIDADLAHDADSVALVFGDPAPELNGWYRKIGSSGSGSWEQFEELSRNSRIVAEAAALSAAEDAGRSKDEADRAQLLADGLTIDAIFASATALPDPNLVGSDELLIARDGGVHRVGMFALAEYLGSSPVAPPVFTQAPSIISDSSPMVGQIITFDFGVVTGGTIASAELLRDAAVIDDNLGAAYSLDPADEGELLRIRVRATGAGGTASAISDPIGPIAAALPAVLNSSVMFPPENGVTASAETSGQVQLTGARTALVGAAGTSAALWGSAQSVMIVLELDRELVDGRNLRCGAFGSIGTGGAGLSGASSARAIGLQYASRSYGTTAERGNWYFYIRGESLTAAQWIIPLTTMPATAKGPFIALAWNDETNGYLSVYDASAAMWYDSAPVAKPAGWAGCSTITNEIVVGGDGSYLFPANNAALRQGGNQWIGAFRDLIFANTAMSKADALAIFNGADPATQLGSASNLRLHVPGAVDGAFSNTKSGTAAAGVTVTQQGVLLAGPSIKRHTMINYVTIDRRAPVLGTNPGTTEATVQLSGTHGGTATGTLQVRQVGASGTVYRGWQTVINTGGAGTWQCVTTLNAAPEVCDIQVRFLAAPTLVANTGLRHWVKPIIIVHGQSEAVYSVFFENTARTLGTATPLAIPLVAGSRKVSFGARTTLGVYCRVQSGELGGYLGNPATAIANIIGPDHAAHIVVNAIGGTSMAHLMNDAQPARQWQDTLDRCANIGNRDATGAIPVHTHIIVGWESNYSGVDGVMRGWYRPFLTGVASTDVPAGDIDHWLFNGEFSADADVIVIPCNRASAVNAAGATVADASVEAGQRDQMRNFAHILGYTVGPEQTTHKLEGENAASGSLVAATHPENNDYEGEVEMAVLNAAAILMALGESNYPGPVFFETITAGSAAEQVRVQLGLPRPQPGLGLAEDATGYSTAPQSGTFDFALHTKLASGNAGAGFEARVRPSGGSFGAWSKLNVTNGTIIDAATGLVELTLSAPLAAGDTVEVRYHPGAPGAYSTATITQAAWRAGSLWFNGAALASAPASLTDVRSLGFAVAGSNQALSFTA